MSSMSSTRRISILLWALAFCTSWSLTACGPDTGVGASSVNSDDDEDSSSSGGGSSGGGGGGYYTPPTTYALSIEPSSESPVSGPTAMNRERVDFNGDGKADFAIASDAGDDVKILLGQSGGNFTSGTSKSLASGAVPKDVVAGDLDADGKVDFLVSYSVGSSHFVARFFGAGDGTFSSASSFSTSVSFEHLLLGDLDGDTYPDLVGLNSGSGAGKVVSRFNDGDGSFGTEVVEVLTSDEPTGGVLYDFDGDDLLDLAIIEGSDLRAAILLNANDPDEGFEAPSFLSLPGAPTAILALSDGSLVVGTAIEGYYFASNGNGTFDSLESVGTGPIGDSFVGLVELDSGAIARVVESSSGDESLAVFAEDSDGVGYPDAHESYPVFGNASIGAKLFASCDLDGDSSLDLVYVTAANRIVTLFNPTASPNAVFSPALSGGTTLALEAPLYANSGTTAFELNDESMAYFSIGSTGLHWVTEESGVITPETALGSVAPVAVASGDFDGDGDTDVAFATAGTDRLLYLGTQGSGSAFTVTSTAVGNGCVEIIAANLGLGTAAALEIIVLNNGEFRVYRDGLTLHQTVATGGFGAPTCVAAYGGKLYMGHDDGDIYIRGNSGGSYSGYELVASLGSAAKAIVADDFDGDGDVDLGVAVGSTVKVIGQSSSGWSVLDTYTVSSTVKTLVAEDMNGDDKLDLVALSGSSSTQGYLHVFHGNETLYFAGPTTFTGPYNATGLFVGDVVGEDGKPDVVYHCVDTSNASNNKVARGKNTSYTN